MEQRLNTLLQKKYSKDLKTATTNEIYNALLDITKEEMAGKERIAGKKKLYYISAEFLIGKLLSNNLINLGLFEEVDKVLKKYEKDITEIEEAELEPSLGNGGLGRLAACFLDSIASLNLPGDGIGLNYHYGLFEQKFENGLQKEVKNPWLTEDSWLVKRDCDFKVPFRRFTAKATLYDIDVPGYETNSCNALHLFDLGTVDDNVVKDDSIDFDKEEIEKNLTLFLYPDDGDRKGRLLRIYQQYFMVSCGAQLILKETRERGGDIHKLNEYVTIQINDTHPSMVIPELIRLLLNEGFTMDEAVSVVRKTCAYTNHTILAEALEKWPMDYMEDVVPHLLPIIRELDNRVRKEVADPTTYIIDDEGRVHMAHMDIHYGYSINGVAALHTEILKDSELNAFYRLYPGKFNNKTNGITFRRWLMSCNPALAARIDDAIGAGWRRDSAELEKLLAHIDDAALLTSLAEIKRANKRRFADWLRGHQGTVIDPDSVFDVQSKRLHEYKRQQLNLLWCVRTLLDIRAGILPERPVTVIFGAKAAPAYTIAKDIIHAILCLSDVIDADPAARRHLRIAMVENYNVSAAEKLIPACDISEQISLASKEASGTGNMKFMLNGAVTLGTLDGANVEIAELVGPENIYTFGLSSEAVINSYARGDYDPAAYLEADPRLKAALDFLVCDEMRTMGDAARLERLHAELQNKDCFMTFPDFADYCATKARMLADLGDEAAWARKALVNIAMAGYFSSDRTIADYDRDIWQVGSAR